MSKKILTTMAIPLMAFASPGKCPDDQSQSDCGRCEPTYNESYVLNWSGAKQFGTTSNDQGYSVDTDNLGSVYVTGHTAGNLFSEKAGVGDLIYS